jgi:queuine/archaeosine tRNA-ribosyltransferase
LTRPAFVFVRRHTIRDFDVGTHDLCSSLYLHTRAHARTHTHTHTHSHNLKVLNEKLEELREAIAHNPVDFWEYRIAHRSSPPPPTHQLRTHSAGGCE